MNWRWMRQRNDLIRISGFLVVLLIILLLTTTVSAVKVNQSGPDLIITECNVSIDATEHGKIAIGKVPDQRVVLSVIVKNDGGREASGYRIRTLLTKEGREDAVVAHIGNDIIDTMLGSGESKRFSKSYTIPKTVYPGKYQVIVKIDASDFFPEENTENNRFVSESIVYVGDLKSDDFTPVYSEGKLEKPGIYILQRDIDVYGLNDVFQITCSDVTLDGNGKTLSGSSTGFSVGIKADISKNIQNIVIKNLTVKGFDTGIWYYKEQDGEISNCNFIDNVEYGIRFDQSLKNKISGNTFTNNEIGLGLFQSSANTVYNNLLNSKFNAIINDEFANVWNIEPITGINIVGGNSIAGNAWLTPDNQGYSQTANDLNGDGIIDVPYSIGPKNIDYYPLSVNTKTDSVVVTEPTVSEVATEITVTQGSTVNETVVIPDTTVNEVVTEPTLTPEPTVREVATEMTITPESTDREPVNETAPASRYLDLDLVSLEIPDSSCLSETIPVTVVIKNVGGYPADTFLIHYYLSNDRRITSDDASLSLEEVTGPFKPGEERVINSVLSIPSKTGTSKYFIIVSAELIIPTFEPVTANNQIVSPNRILINNC